MGTCHLEGGYWEGHWRNGICVWNTWENQWPAWTTTLKCPIPIPPRSNACGGQVVVIFYYSNLILLKHSLTPPFQWGGQKFRNLSFWHNTGLLRLGCSFHCEFNSWIFHNTINFSSGEYESWFKENTVGSWWQARRFFSFEHIFLLLCLLHPLCPDSVLWWKYVRNSTFLLESEVLCGSFANNYSFLL